MLLVNLENKALSTILNSYVFSIIVNSYNFKNLFKRS